MVTLLWKTFRGRIKAVNGLGAGLGAVLVLGPVLHPWYILWAALPLATGVVAKHFRVFATSASASVAIILPPTGSAFDGRAYIVSQAVVGAVITFAVCLLLARKQAPPRAPRDFRDWRSTPVGNTTEPTRMAPWRHDGGCPTNASPVARPRLAGREPERASPRPAVEVSGLVKQYGSKTAVDGLDLVQQPGTVLALLGPNGAGKTTTVEMCEGFRSADGQLASSGSTRSPERRRSAAHRRDAAGRRRLSRRPRRARCSTWSRRARPTRSTRKWLIDDRSG